MVTRKNPIFDTATTLGKIFGFLGVSAICGVLVAGLLVPAAAVSGSAASGSIEFFDTLPAELKVDPPNQTTRILAADGSVIASVFEENRTKVSLDKISPFMKEAVIAVEDSRFYEHGGVDTTGIMRALVATARGNKQGASTITQQYVNNVLNANLAAEGKDEDIKLNGVNKGVGDKLREMKLAIALEKEFTKDQILEGYLNIVFFNRDAYGIEAASKFFFSTTAKDLTLPQAALLAGLVNSPSAFDPITNPESSKGRRDLVLSLMLSQGKITQAEHDAAVATPVETKVTPARQGCAYAATAPYFCDYVLHLLENNPAYGADLEEREKKIFRGGLTIKTTLDPKAQKAAQDQVNAAAGPTRTSGALPSSPWSRRPARSPTWPRTPRGFRARESSTPRSTSALTSTRQGQRPERPRRRPARVHHEAVHVCPVAEGGQVDEHHRQRLPAPLRSGLPVAEHLPHPHRRMVRQHQRHG